MKAFFILTAIIEFGAGLALLGFPSLTSRLLIGEPLVTHAALIVARICGAGLFALGTASWLARSDRPGPAARGLMAALLFYNVATSVVLLFASMGYGLRGVLLWPAVFLHTGMAFWCVVLLSANLRAKL